MGLYDAKTYGMSFDGLVRLLKDTTNYTEREIHRHVEAAAEDWMSKLPVDRRGTPIKNHIDEASLYWAYAATLLDKTVGDDEEGHWEIKLSAETGIMEMTIHRDAGSASARVLLATYKPDLHTTWKWDEDPEVVHDRIKAAVTAIDNAANNVAVEM